MDSIYKLLFRRSSAQAVVIGVGVFAFEAVYELLADKWFNNRNKEKLWREDNYKKKS